jgi:hypothetical protein
MLDRWVGIAGVGVSYSDSGGFGDGFGEGQTNRIVVGGRFFREYVIDCNETTRHFCDEVDLEL